VNKESYNDGTFNFTNLIRVLNSITIKLYAGSVVGAEEGTRFRSCTAITDDPYTWETTDFEPHGLSSGDVVVCTDLGSYSADTDVYTYLDSTDGFYVVTNDTPDDSIIRIIDGKPVGSGVIVRTMTFPKFNAWPATDTLILTATHGSPTTFTSNIEHRLYTGDVVYISGFNVDDSKVDRAAVETINAKSGISVTVTSTTAFTVAAATTLGNEGTNLYITAFVEKCRLVIPMEISYYAEDED
jgi:hypothetical protein